MITLFPDQQDSVDAVAEKMRQGSKSILMQGATGSGKSIISTYIVQRAMAKNRNILFTVPRRDLVRQMASTFNSFGLDYSYIAAGKSFNPYAQAHIASTETLKRRLSKMRPPHLAIIDETHYGGKGLDEIISWLKDAGSYIIGLSATPWRLSGQGLGCWYDDMTVGPSIRWLIDNKRLSDYRAFAPSQVDLSGVKKIAGDYAKGDLSGRMEDRVLVGNAVSHYKKHAMGKLGVTFACSRKHSEILAQTYRDQGISAMHVDGETPMDERARIFKAYANREIMQLTCAELLTFGFDIASASGVKDVTVQCITDCQPTQSLAKQMQKWGRGLRYDPEPHLFLDHANNFDPETGHGLPCSERDWSLADWKKKRGSGEAEKSVPVRQCDECYFCHPPAETCPNCGYEYPVKYRTIEEIEGELEEIKAEKEVEETEAKKKARMEVGQANTLDDLRNIAKDRGYAKGWVYQMARVKNIKK